MKAIILSVVGMFTTTTACFCQSDTFLHGEVSRSRLNSDHTYRLQRGVPQELTPQEIDAILSREDLWQLPEAASVTPPAKKVEKLPMGVVGDHVERSTGVIQDICKGSDLLRFGIQAGDKILRTNGHPFVFEQFQQDCLGPAGTTVQLTVRSKKHGEITINVMRKDARVFWQEDTDGWFHQAAALNK